MQGDTAKAKTAYQDFLTLWKDADPDVPVLKEAKPSTRGRNKFGNENCGKVVARILTLLPKLTSLTTHFALPNLLPKSLPNFAPNPPESCLL